MGSTPRISSGEHDTLLKIPVQARGLSSQIYFNSPALGMTFYGIYRWFGWIGYPFSFMIQRHDMGKWKWRHVSLLFWHENLRRGFCIGIQWGSDGIKRAG